MAFFTGARDFTSYKDIFADVAGDQFIVTSNITIYGDHCGNAQISKDQKPSFLPPNKVHVDVSLIDGK
jgi:hypothetical protein